MEGKILPGGWMLESGRRLRLAMRGLRRLAFFFSFYPDGLDIGQKRNFPHLPRNYERYPGNEAGGRALAVQKYGKACAHGGKQRPSLWN